MQTLRAQEGSNVILVGDHFNLDVYVRLVTKL